MGSGAPVWVFAGRKPDLVITTLFAPKQVNENRLYYFAERLENMRPRSWELVNNV